MGPPSVTVGVVSNGFTVEVTTPVPSFMAGEYKTLYVAMSVEEVLTLVERVLSRA